MSTEFDELLKHIDYYNTYKREVERRQNQLAKISAMRELVAVAKAICCHVDFPNLTANMRQDIANTILQTQAWLCGYDHEQRKYDVPGLGMHACHEAELEIMHGQFNLRMDAAKERKDKMKEAE